MSAKPPPGKKQAIPSKYLDSKKDGKSQPAHGKHKPPPHKPAPHKGTAVNPQAAKAMALIAALKGHMVPGPQQGMPPQGVPGIPQQGGPAPVPPMQPQMKPTP